MRPGHLTRLQGAAVALGGLLASGLSALGVSPQVGAATPAIEFGAVVNGCATLGLGVPNDNYPIFQVNLYNMQGTPSASATASLGSFSTPLQLGSPLADGTLAGAYSFTAPNPLLVGANQPVTVSVKWSDPARTTSGSFQQIVGVRDCNANALGPLPPVQVALAPNASANGYWIASSVGEVRPLGQAYSLGDMSAIPLAAPIVNLATTPDGNGYWLLGADGGVFSFGTAHFYGSTANLKLNSAVVAMAATPDGAGYWIVARDGGVFAFGDAAFRGSMGGKPLNRPIVGLTVDEATGGYWMVATDGGIFSFDAPFNGSTGGHPLVSPVVGMQASPDGSGYRLGAGDGGVFSFGLPFAGSYAGLDHRGSLVGIAGHGTTAYWLLDSCGDVFAFGSAAYFGGAHGLPC